MCCITLELNLPEWEETPREEIYHERDFKSEKKTLVLCPPVSKR